MNKELFLEIMSEVQKTYEYQEGLNDFLKKQDVDGYIYQPDCVCSTLKLMHYIFGEKDADEWISYFCFELDFGKKYKDGLVKNAYGDDIVLKTLDDLYELLTE